MKIRFSVSFSVFAALVCAVSFAAAAEVTIDSPRKLVRGTVTIDETLSLGLTFGGKTVLTDSPLGLTFEEGAYGPLAVLRTETRQINNTWENRFGRFRVVRDRATEVTVYCQERSAPNRRLTLLLRAYDDGFAFRYVVPGKEDEQYVLTEE
ncbi:MAG: glycoside hydrolase family 97 N-terminal domain-containing protein, partial [Thermoguttaceae bacterium]|nr:glycoside hydrolase family 97 N-terminal domain-containing protein [Thermoguttaceae bacterium]